MNEIESKFQDYINQLKSLQNSNYSVYEFYKKALQIENNFYKAVHDTDPDDYKGKYARCVILGKYKDFNCEGMLEQLNKLPESLKNENINSYYLRFPDKNISNQINKFIGDFSKLKNLSE
ncbi:MAG: hypothetical protein SFT90_03515, partial [Rickettsiales bacterium]|nr:hypothetical protein [Rickettsiales bacterium]